MEYIKNNRGIYFSLDLLADNLYNMFLPNNSGLELGTMKILLYSDESKIHYSMGEYLTPGLNYLELVEFHMS